MLRFIHAKQLKGRLRSTMFKDRARQFRDRLKWDVVVDERGWETDQYDVLNPLYVIWQTHDGEHGGSMRLLPTMGRTMIREHFRELDPEDSLAQPSIWECTRFCLSPGADGKVAAALMQGGAEFMLRFGISSLLGVFDRRMLRVYRQLGACPDVIGSVVRGPEYISVGLWNHTESAYGALSLRSGLQSDQVRLWLETDMAEVHRKAGFPPLLRSGLLLVSKPEHDRSGGADCQEENSRANLVRG